MLNRALCLATVLVARSLSAAPAGDSINYNTYAQATAETKALVQRVIKGFGGETALRAVHSVHKVADIDEVNSKGKKLQTRLDGVAVFPNSVYAKVIVPNGSFTAVTTPDMAFMYPANATVQHAALKLNETEKSTLTRYFYEEPLLVLRNRIDPSYLFATGPKVKVNGVDADTLYVHANGMDMQWFVDANGRVLRSRTEAKTVDFSNWRDVNGISVPFSSRVEDGGQVSSVTYREFELNPDVTAEAMFERPTLWMTRTSLPALGRRMTASSAGFGDYVNAYMDDYGYSDSSSSSSFDTYIFAIFATNY